MIFTPRKKRRRSKGTRGPTIRRERCFVYFIRADLGEESLVKIGFTAVDVERRCRALALGSPVALTVMGHFTGMQQDEIDLHRRYAHLRRHREWFLLDEALASEIDYLCWGSR